MERISIQSRITAAAYSRSVAVLSCVFLFSGCAGIAKRPVYEEIVTTGRATHAPPGGRASTESLSDETIILESEAYDVVYSETKRNPLVVSYFLRAHSDQDYEPCDRPSRFIRDARRS